MKTEKYYIYQLKCHFYPDLHNIIFVNTNNE